MHSYLTCLHIRPVYVHHTSQSLDKLMLVVYLIFIVGLEIDFEEADYSITEGSGLSAPIRLQFTNNQNPFNIRFSAVNITNAEGKGVGSFIIEEEARATSGYVLNCMHTFCMYYSAIVFWSSQKIKVTT